MYIRKKKNAQGKEYAYEVRAYWDKEKKQSRSKSKYIGRVDSNGDIIPKGRKKIRKKDLNNFNEGIIEDFGDSYFVKQLIERVCQKDCVSCKKERNVICFPELSYKTQNEESI